MAAIRELDYLLSKSTFNISMTTKQFLQTTCTIIII